MTTRRLDTPRNERAELAEHVESYAGFVLANLLWALASLPLVTLPAATAGLFAVMLARVRGEPGSTIHTFIEGMQQHWRRATTLILLNLLGGGLVALNAVIFPMMDLSTDPLAFVARSVTLFAALALVVMNVYAWPLLVLFESMSLKTVLASSARLALTHPLMSLGLAVTAVVIVGVSLLLPRGVFALATASGVALVVSFGAWRVIRGHVVEGT
jgi:uncharacterized membrane protein YesL